MRLHDSSVELAGGALPRAHCKHSLNIEQFSRFGRELAQRQDTSSTQFEP